MLNYRRETVLLRRTRQSQSRSKRELKNEDGKIELAFNDIRKIMLVDVLGTLDECRFTYKGVHVSKEVARQFYKKTAWYNDLEAAKKEGEAKGIQDWKALCKTQPPKLDQKLKTIISQMYMSAANEMSNKKLFDTPKLAKVIAEYQEYMGKKA
jgi:phosphoribosylaminoimidazole-succinocarboxamide synthase